MGKNGRDASALARPYYISTLQPNNQYIYKNTVTLEEVKRSGKPCIRETRITVEDILHWLASDMSIEEILEVFQN